MATRTKSETVAMPTDNTAPLGATAYEAGATPIDSSTKAPTFLSILSNMKTSSKLDSAAMAYVDEIDRIFKDSHEQITSLPINTDKIEARVYVHDASRFAIALLFAESHQALDMTPPAVRTVDVIKAVAAKDDSIKVVQSIVVTKEDYALAAKMAAFIINAFQTVSGGDATNLNVNQLKGLKISVITAIDKVRQYVREVSPHAVADRDDIGVLLCFEMPQDKNNGFQREVDLKPFLAITGYTRIMNPQDAAVGCRFVPIPTITNVISSIPNSALLAIALPMAADAFILQNLWIRPYTTFRSGCPNLGNLITDPATKKPLFTDTNEAFHGFINQYTTAPFLAIDVTEGRARCLGIDNLVYNPGQVLSNVCNFFKIDPSDPAYNFGVKSGCLMAFTNFTGSYIDNGILKDTRCVDYLELACKVADYKQIEDLLLQPNQPQVRIERIRGIYPEATKSLYTTTTVVLDANAIGTMNRALAMHNIQLRYDMPASGNVNLNQFINVAGGNAFSGFQAIGMGFGPQSFNIANNNPYANIAF